MTSGDGPEPDRALRPRPAAARQGTTRKRRPSASAGNPVLAAKMTVPGVPDWAVQRPRIIEMIGQGTRGCPLTVLTGPPGAGKTMALASWAATQPGTVAWVSLDEYDNQPGVCWSYVVEALRRSRVAVPAEWPGAGCAGDDGLVPRLAAALAAQEPPVTLILDDLHVLAEPGVLKGLDFLLRNAAEGLRLAVASRMDPLLPLHRYRVAGQLTEIRAADLAFTAAEAGLLLAQHGCTLSPDLLESLTCRTEGWPTGLRLAALSISTHPDPGQFIKELIAEDSALTSYLVAEVLNAQPPEVRQVLLSTSILEQVSADAAVELTGDERAARIVPALARANAFIQSAGGGWYRYHTLFAEALRLKLRYEYPDRVTVLHRRAARWYERNGLLADAVRHATRAGDWPLAASMVIEDLAISQILQPRDGQRLAGEFATMPSGRAWTGPQPYLISAAVALAAEQPESCATALDAADRLLECLPAGQEPEARLAAALIRLPAALRAGDLPAAASAAARAEVLAGQVPGGKLARHPEIKARVLSGRGAVELWSGHLDEAAHVLESGVAVQAASGSEDEPADCLGHLALVEALRGRLGRAAKLADRVAAASGSGQAGPNSAALVALAWVHLERDELRLARSRLKQADTALSASPDELIAGVACLVAAGGALAEGRTATVEQIIARARSGWPVPDWLDQQLSLIQSRACAASGDIPAALTAAQRAGRDDSLEAAVTRAHAWAAARHGDNARRALAPALAAGSQVTARVRVHARLVEARLSYTSGDYERGRRSLAAALRLAEPDQLRLPFAVERDWIGPLLLRDPQLASAHRRLLAPALRGQLPAPAGVPEQAAVPVVVPLSDREREVLLHVSRFLSTAEIASEMYITVNTVKTHLRNIYRKLAADHRGQAVRRARQLELI